jgi:hypothetical protein
LLSDAGGTKDEHVPVRNLIGLRSQRRPTLRAGEQVQLVTKADLFETPWWQTRWGYLILTNQRLIFSPRTASYLPKRLFAPSLDWDLHAIQRVDCERSVWRQFFTGMTGFDTLTIVLADGRVYRFQLFGGEKVKEHLLATMS